MNTSNTSKPIKKRSRLKVVLIVVGVLIFLALANHFTSISNARQIEKATAQDSAARITTQRALANTTTDNEVNNVIAVLKNEGITWNLIASSKVDVCKIERESAGSGIIGSSRTQRCYLYATAGYTTLDSINLVREKLERNPEITPAFTSTDNQCTILFKDPDSPTYKIGDTPRANMIYSYSRIKYLPVGIRTNTSTELNDTCLIDPTDIESSGSAFDIVSIKPYNTYDPSTVSDAENQVWITLHVQYYTEDLSCLPSFFALGCDPVRTQPVHPDI